jgi:hypothetical protein
MFFNPLSWLTTGWFHITASGLIDAVWGEVWHWGLGIGVMILCIVGAFLSPVGKQLFAGAAFATFCLLVAYGYGQKDRAAICEAQVKELYLKSHPGITAKNIAKNWRVSPNWIPGQKQAPVSRRAPKSTCSPGGWGC